MYECLSSKGSQLWRISWLCSKIDNRSIT